MGKLYSLYRERYRHFNLLLLFIPSTLIFYFFQIYTEPKYIMHIKLDDYIPFIKYFVIPYVFWYFYCGWAYIYFGLYSKKEFVCFIKFILIGAYVAYAIYFLFPNAQDLRNVIGNDDIFLMIINNIRNSDPPTNVFPSLHVYNSIGVNIAICTSEAFKNKKFPKIFAYISTILISISTVCIKQHSILDVVGAVVVAFAVFMFVYYPVLYKSKYELEEAV